MKGLFVAFPCVFNYHETNIFEGFCEEEIHETMHHTCISRLRPGRNGAIAEFLLREKQGPFDIYFAQEGYELAQFAADAAEEAYASIRKLMRYDINNRVTMVVHNSHNEFQQTNVIDQYLEEGIGGVPELFKNRIVLPFEGNYQMYRHVIHHELVHAVINDMFYGGTIQSLISS
ncbi:MAG: WD40 domain protein beta Propeller, partial [Bacteroidetes bacterium]|nr:WD40 domain protein beta Propeller [Bacteroidota bacterium]